MIAVDIPGLRELRLEHLVLDYNGTLAEDGKLLPGVATTLQALARTRCRFMLSPRTRLALLQNSSPDSR